MKALRLTCTFPLLVVSATIAQQPAGFIPDHVVTTATNVVTTNAAHPGKLDAISLTNQTSRETAPRPNFNAPATGQTNDNRAVAGETIQDTKAKAEKGEAEAQVRLGASYFIGQGVEQDYTEAVKWLQKAAEQGVARAQVFLGSAYANGQGVAQDQAEALKWYRKAAEQDDSAAQVYLGMCYAYGFGVNKDTAEAAKLLRKAAEQGLREAQYFLGQCYANGNGVSNDKTEAAKWWQKAADQGLSVAQHDLGLCYERGDGVAKDAVEAAKWYRKAAEQNDAGAQSNLGVLYEKGEGVAKDYMEAVRWYRKAAEQNDAGAQFNLGRCYAFGDGVAKDYVQAYEWVLLAGAQGNEIAKKLRTDLEGLMTREQIAEGQKLARNFKPRQAQESGARLSRKDAADFQLTTSATGFFITANGFLITNAHVVEGAAQVRLVTSAGLISAKVVKVDAANDLALLKAEGRFAPLPVVASRAVKLGGTVATVGFPNIGLQGFAPKLAKGEIASLSGAGDDARYFQISVPVQPGNSGGALVDERGNVVGVVSAKLSARAALASSGALPENVNYAVKSSYLLSFLESVPEVSAKLKEPETKERKFEDVVKAAEQAAVLVLVC